MLLEGAHKCQCYSSDGVQRDKREKKYPPDSVHNSDDVQHPDGRGHVSCDEICSLENSSFMEIFYDRNTLIG